MIAFLHIQLLAGMGLARSLNRFGHSGPISNGSMFLAIGFLFFISLVCYLILRSAMNEADHEKNEE